MTLQIRWLEKYNQDYFDLPESRSEAVDRKITTEFAIRDLNLAHDATFDGSKTKEEMGDHWCQGVRYQLLNPLKVELYHLKLWIKMHKKGRKKYSGCSRG